MRGKLIEFEGLDYSFKETNTKLLVDYIKREKETDKVVLLSFPNYESDSARYVKEYLSGEYGSAKDLNPYATSTLFLIDRLVTTKRTKIEELLNDGYYVILDRYVFSNIFFQSTKLETFQERKEFRDWIYDLEFNKVGLPRPDITIYMNMPVSVSYPLMQERKNKTGDTIDVHEDNMNFILDVERVANEVIREYNIPIVECSNFGNVREGEEIFSDIINVLENHSIL